MNTDRYLNCINLGLNKPTEVLYKDQLCKTVGLSIKELVTEWRLRWFYEENEPEWLVLGIDNLLWERITQHMFNREEFPSVWEDFYRYKVICVRKEND